MKKNTVVAGPTVSCGLQPVAAEYKYAGITTKTVESWLQKKMDALVAINNKQYDAMEQQGKTPTERKLEKFDIKLISVTQKVTNRFSPFLLMLPTEAIEKYKRKPRGPKDNEIAAMSEEFLARQNGGENIEIHNAVYSLLADFMFKPAKSRLKKNQRACSDMSIEEYINRAWERFGMARSEMQTLMRAARPQLVKYGKTRRTCVAVLLSPVLVLHSMLIDPDNLNERFEIGITDLKFISKTICSFEVVRRSVEIVYNDSEDELLTAIYHQMDVSKTGGRSNKDRDNRRGNDRNDRRQRR